MKLYVPSNIKIKTEFVQGLGWYELRQALIGVVTLLGLDLAIFFIFKTMTACIVFGMISVAGSIMFTRRDLSNQSIVDQIKFLMRFMKGQRRYKYVTKNEWSD